MKDIDTQELMRKISFVFQDSKLIRGSIIDNLRISKPEADINEINNAITNAQCSDIIAKFPEGLNTIIGSEGVYLSGGETQRLCVARAFLKDSPIIILDEATAYSDPDNESKMQKALTNLSANKTLIMIAHRLSYVKNADVIAVLNEGKLVETGKFDELINHNGVFASMWRDYQNSLSWKIK